MNEPVEPTTPYSVTLQAQQWNALISWLVKAPYEMAAPILQSLHSQLGIGPGAQQPVSPPNGSGLPAAPPPH